MDVVSQKSGVGEGDGEADYEDKLRERKCETIRRVDELAFHLFISSSLFFPE